MVSDDFFAQLAAEYVTPAPVAELRDGSARRFHRPVARVHRPREPRPATVGAGARVAAIAATCAMLGLVAALSIVLTLGKSEAPRGPAAAVRRGPGPQLGYSSSARRCVPPVTCARPPRPRRSMSGRSSRAHRVASSRRRSATPSKRATRRTRRPASPAPRARPAQTPVPPPVAAPVVPTSPPSSVAPSTSATARAPREPIASEAPCEFPPC